MTVNKGEKSQSNSRRAWSLPANSARIVHSQRRSTQQAVTECGPVPALEAPTQVWSFPVTPLASVTLSSNLLFIFFLARCERVSFSGRRSELSVGRTVSDIVPRDAGDGAVIWKHGPDNGGREQGDHCPDSCIPTASFLHMG